MSASSRPRAGSASGVVVLAAACAVALAGVAVAGTAAATGGSGSTGSGTTQGSRSTGSPNLLQRSSHLYGSSPRDWTPSYARITGATTPASGSGTVAVSSTGSGYAVATLGGGGGPIAATPGNVYTGVLSLQAQRRSRAVAAYLLFYSAKGSLLATVEGQQAQDLVGGWERIEPVVAIAPAGAAYVAMRMVWQAPAGEWHYLSDPVLTTRAGGSRAIVGPLRTVANKVYDARGPVVLRGLHRFGFEGSVAGTGIPRNFSQNEVARAKAWGANVVRISLASPFWLSTDCHFDPTYALRVDQAVRWVTAAGMVALLDYHFNSTSDCSRIGPQLMADARGPRFLRALADHYKSNPLVAFDLYNEPHDISDSVWLRGGQVQSDGRVWTATGMQELYDAVRSTGASNLVVISGNSWANRLPAQLVRGTNIVYGVHAYTCPTSPTGVDCQVDAYDPTSILAGWVGRAARYPVMVSEFGWPGKDDGRFARNVISYAEEHGWGWIAFAWDGSTDGTFDLLADVKHDYQPSPSGMPVLAGLARN